MPNLPEDTKVFVGKVQRTFNVTPHLSRFPFLRPFGLVALYIDNCAPKLSVSNILHLSDAPLGAIVNLMGRYLCLATLSQGLELVGGLGDTGKFFRRRLALLRIC